jgi:hypothetical protein
MPRSGVTRNTNPRPPLVPLVCRVHTSTPTAPSGRRTRVRKAVNRIP